MDESARAELLEDVVALVEKYEGVALVVFGFAYMDEEGDLSGQGHVLVPVDSVDHEEEILRKQASKEVFALTKKVAQNIYDGRELPDA